MQALGHFDYIIVGAGSAGCVLANRLSADPDIKVLVLEAGGKDDYIWIHIPVGYLYCMGNPRTDWGFSTAPEPGLNGRSLNYPRGKVLGGCSAINGMIYMRGQAADYDRWRQMGLAGWGWDDVLPLFRKGEDHYALDDEFHARGGGCRVEEQRLSWEILDAFRDACEENGIPKIADFNLGDNFGSAYFQVTQTSGIRWTAAKGFLKPAMKRPNLTVVTGAQVSRIRMQDGRAVGLDLTVNGEPARADASGEIILSSGAVGSPQILELSGIGNPQILGKHGIQTAVANPAVGENLQDHLQIRTIFKVSNALTLNQLTNSLAGKAKIALEYALKRSGPMSMAPSQLGVFARSDDSFETPNVEYHIQPLSLDRFGEPLHSFPAITASVCNLRPDSRGHIHIASADPRSQPEIRANYLSAETDRRVAADSIRLTRRIMASKALSKYEPVEHLPGSRVHTDEDLAKAAGDIGTTIFHPVGTCRMGADEASVVDERLRVRGIGGLRVVDASVMPTITSGNTAAPTMMIAEKASEMIRADRRAGA
ncbi:GMC family oxidoreductase N-terminal domain-containing protein [Stappia sp. F7233]|uniref:GMC family oxidoreductase N-terminal domain-containing protein n=1 Tax=Stappia albiluteola TaxID=2758565 RepID=A0A839AE39_9HYPH|nr:GMC family oxidoreductase N-terminal domain-containing protein [Stappia albiluteola]MBA5777405.1 GMC family oxidoreductase N-terminal domain-containing protein [Stappia albiluteola]